MNPVTSDMSADLRSVVLLGPRARPPIGGQYHPNARQRQAAESGARRQRVQKLLQIHESRKAFADMERGLAEHRAALQAMEEEAGVDGVRTLSMFKSPAVPALLARKRRLESALLDADKPCGSCQAGGDAVKRNRLEVHDDDVARARRRLDDGLGVLLRHKRLTALQDEERGRQRAEVLHDGAGRRRHFAAVQDEELSRHLVALAQDEHLRRRRRDDARVERDRQQRAGAVEGGAHRHHRDELVHRCHRNVQADTSRCQPLEDCKEKVAVKHRYQQVLGELREAQKKATVADLKIELTAASSGDASPPAPVPRRFAIYEDDESPMMTAWCNKPGFEPTTPTDLIPSPLFMRGPRGVPGATRDPLCRSPDALCRSPNAMCRSPSAR